MGREGAESAGLIGCRPVFAISVARVPCISTMLTDTVTATVLKVGRKCNVTLDRAEVVLDVRLLPDADAREFVQRLKWDINDPSVSVEAGVLPSVVHASLIDSEIVRALRHAIETHVADAVVVLMQTPVATDSRFFRARGANAYGLVPAVLMQTDLDGAHGVDEMLPVART